MQTMKVAVSCLLAFLLFLASTAVPIGLGDNCADFYKDDVTGICKLSTECPALIASIRDSGYHNLTRCGFSGKIEKVCCPPSPVSNSRSGVPPGIPSKETLDIIKQDCKTNNHVINSFSRRQILKGTNAVLGEFPHMAALGYLDFNTNNYTFFCGGTLINDRYVLTAAHCLLKQVKVEVVRIGAVDILKHGVEGEDYKVEKQIINKLYKPRTKDNDIALLKLARPVKVNKEIRYACLYDKEDVPGVMVATGWGTTEDKGLVGSPILQKVSLTHTDNQKCGETLERNVLNSQLCAWSDVGGDTCQGDSGGPLQIQQPENDVMSVVGVTSIGRGCGSRPGLYTKVYYYLDWIVDIIHN